MVTSMPGAPDDYGTHIGTDLVGPHIDKLEVSSVATEKLVSGPIHFNTRSYGAVCDGTTDDTTAIQAAITAATAATPIGKVIHAGKSKITARINITCHFDGTAGEFTTTAVLNPAVEIGYSNHTTDFFDPHIILPKITQTTQTWAADASYADCGVAITNTIGGHITVRNINNFAINLLLRSYNGHGCGYNNIYIQTLENGKVPLRLQAADTGSGSWVNENNFFGGRYTYQYTPSVGGATSNVTGTRGIQLLLDSGNTAASSPNGNKFFGPSLEGDIPVYHIECYGTSNLFIAPRFDTNLETPKIHWGSGGTTYSFYNRIIGGGYGIRNAIITTDANSLKNEVEALQQIHNAAGDLIIATDRLGNDISTIFAAVAGAVNYMTVNGSTTGNGAVTLAVNGTDTDIYFILTPKGAGEVRPGKTKFTSTVGFNNTAPIAKPTVTGSRSANAALASLLTALANYGLIVDSSS